MSARTFMSHFSRSSLRGRNPFSLPWRGPVLAALPVVHVPLGPLRRRDGKPQEQECFSPSRTLCEARTIPLKSTPCSARTERSSANVAGACHGKVRAPRQTNPYRRGLRTVRDSAWLRTRWSGWSLSRSSEYKQHLPSVNTLRLKPLVPTPNVNGCCARIGRIHSSSTNPTLIRFPWEIRKLERLPFLSNSTAAQLLATLWLESRATATSHQR